MMSGQTRTGLAKVDDGGRPYLDSSQPIANGSLRRQWSPKPWSDL